MKQLILIERSELDALRAGATLSLTLNGGQAVLIGLEGRGPRAVEVLPPSRASKYLAPKKRGRGARPLRPALIKQIQALTSEGLPVREITKRLGVGRSSVLKYGKGAKK